MVKLTFTLSEDTEARLNKLSRVYSLSVDTLITQILEAIDQQSQLIPLGHKTSKETPPFKEVFRALLSAGIGSMSYLFNNVLEHLDAVGLFTHDDFEINLDSEFYIWTNFFGTERNHLLVDGFDINIAPGQFLFTAFYRLERDQVTAIQQKKLNTFVQREDEADLFGDIGDYTISI